MNIDRRAFLFGSAALPLIFGLSEPLAQDAAPAWLDAALARMKSLRRYGLVFVVPAEGPKRTELGKDLALLLTHSDPELRDLLSGAVLISLTPELAARSLRGSGETVTRILLDPDGRRLAADTPAVLAQTDPRKFAPLHRAFVYGEKDERLEALSTETEARLTPALRKAFANLDDDDPQVRTSASIELLASADRVLPYAARLRKTAASAEVRWRCDDLLESAFVPGPHNLPFGSLRVPQVNLPPQRECVACGMARVSCETTRDFLKFLTK